MVGPALSVTFDSANPDTVNPSLARPVLQRGGSVKNLRERFEKLAGDQKKAVEESNAKTKRIAVVRGDPSPMKEAPALSVQAAPVFEKPKDDPPSQPVPMLQIERIAPESPPTDSIEMRVKQASIKKFGEHSPSPPRSPKVVLQKSNSDNNFVGRQKPEGRLHNTGESPKIPSEKTPPSPKEAVLESGMIGSFRVNRDWWGYLEKHVHCLTSSALEDACLDGSIRCYFGKDIDGLFNNKRDPLDIPAVDYELKQKLEIHANLTRMNVEEIVLMSFSSKVRELLTLYDTFLALKKKYTREMDKFKFYLEQILNQKDLDGFRKALLESKDFQKIVLTSILGKEKHEFIETTERWKKRVPELAPRVCQELNWRKVEAINITNRGFKYEESATLEYTTKQIYRQEIFRCLAPSITDCKSIEITGLENYHSLEEARKLGNFDEKNYLTLYFTALLTCIYKAGFDEYQASAVNQQVESLLKDKERLSTTEPRNVIPCETMLQLLTMKGWGQYDIFIKSLFPQLNTIPSGKEELENPDPNKRYYSTLGIQNRDSMSIEILAPGCFRVYRQGVFTSYPWYKKTDKNNPIAEFKVEWMIEVNPKINNGLPVGVLSIPEFAFFDEASFEDKWHILNAIIQYNKDYNEVAMS